MYDDAALDPPHYATLLLERSDPHVWVLKFNRPQAANALNTQMGRDILAFFSEMILNPRDVRCIVVTGTGERSFCAGGDIKERDGMSDAAWLAQHVIFEQAFRAMMACPIPLIAAVNGAAYGGGCEFALACDFVYAAESARFAQTETRLGIIPGGGGTQLLARAVGAARAKEIILSALPFDATQALAWGMVNKVSPDALLLEDALATARVIASNAPIAVRQAKLAISNGLEVDLRSGLIIEIAAYNQTVPTADRREGVRAAVERRPPNFKGS
jgi:enoyl-CoA hydratase/carnithine racemase